MGEGEGKTDISDKIESEEQLIGPRVRSKSNKIPRRRRKK